MIAKRDTPLRLRARLASASGETIAETLVSVLVSVLALLILATAIGSAVRVVTTSKNGMEVYYTKESEMAEGSSPEESSVRVDPPISNVSDDPANNGTVIVNVYRGDGIARYERAPMGGTP